MSKKNLTHTKQYLQKIPSFIKQNYKILLFILSFFFINCVFFAFSCSNNNISFTSKRFIIISLFLLIITSVLCFLILFFKHKNWKIENIFLVIGSILGILYLFIIPIGRAPDEPVHIYKVYSIAQGNFINQTENDISGNYLPDNIDSVNSSTYSTNNAYIDTLNNLTIPASDAQSFHNTLSSNPIDYIPQAIGMFIGILLHLPLLITIYLSRLCGLAFCIAVIYFCLKFIPILKKSLFFIACLPLSMQTFISISYDGVIFCSAIALITFILYCLYNKSFKIKAWHYIFIIFASIALIAVKPTYFPLCLLLFFIPTSCFKNKRNKILYISSSLIITIFLFILWSSFSTITQPGNGADTNGQISFILSNPLKYIAILCQNIFDMPVRYLQRFFALEWLNICSNNFYIVCTLVFFVILCIDEYLSTKTVFSKLFRWAIFICFFAITILIFTALYIQWTTVGSTVIEGVQSRYILPILLLLPLACLPPHKNKVSKNLPKPVTSATIYCFLIFLNVNILSTLLCVHI